MGALNYNYFGNDNTGYICISQITGNKIKTEYVTSKNIKEVIKRYEGLQDVYITYNTTYIPQRQVKHIRHLNMLFMDIDLTTYDKTEAVYTIIDLANTGRIPMPSRIVDSGRGIHVYWNIQNAPYAALKTWQHLQDYLYKQLKHIGADPKALDGVRLTRLEGTINSRTGTKCTVIWENDNIYSMYDLRQEYLNYKPAVAKEKKAATKSKVINNKFFNAYSLHTARLNDIEKLVNLRNGDMKGVRNMALHCYAYWTGIYTRDSELLEQQVNEFNNSFNEPLSHTEVRAILRCIPKAVEAFISYVVDGKKPTKGSSDKGGYWYKNETLIQRLEITTEEMQQLESIIDVNIKYARNNERRKESRRNEAGLTSKQQELKELKEQAEALRMAGHSMQQIAKELNVSKAKIVKLINK